MNVIILGLLFASVCASPQYTKTAGVKGGSGRRYYFGENMVKNNYTNTYGAQNTSSYNNYEVGVCYIEVPTATLVRDPAHVPTGNGSRSDLSRIRSCCKGYIQNIHNFRICDPVCTNECVNGLCSAPETCTCFPDHVRNLAGFCIPTCPIGCQNGYCSGGECLCKDGYRPDSQGRFCVPVCRENCGGIGNCTSPNTCECRNGYTTSPEGNCKPACDRCRDGECIQPNVCRCHAGFTQNQNGDCISICKDGNKCSIPGRTNTQSQYPHPDPNANTDRPNRERLTTPNPLYNQHPNRQNSSQYNPHQQYPQPYPQPPYGNQQHPNQYNPYPQIPNQYNPNQYPNQQRPDQYNPNQHRPDPNQQYPNQQNPNQQYPNQQNPNQQYPNQQNPNQQNLNQHGYGQQPNYPYQQPYNPDGQQQYYPIYNIYPGNQHNQGHPNQPARPYNPNPELDSTRPSNPNQDSVRPSDNPNQFYQSSYNRPSNYPDSQYSNQNQTHGNPQGQPMYSNYPQYSNYYIHPVYREVQPVYQYQAQPVDQEKLSNVELLCSTPCINGTCVGQDRCSCFEGYMPDASDPSGTRCQPYCPGCSNGVCISPHVCSCNPGYYMDHGVKGRAKCTRRIRREVEKKPVQVAELLEFLIPDY